MCISVKNQFSLNSSNKQLQVDFLKRTELFNSLLVFAYTLLACEPSARVSGSSRLTLSLSLSVRFD